MRADLFLVQSYLFNSREKACEAIKEGLIFLGDKKISKPSFLIKQQDYESLKIMQSKYYVSRAAKKLEAFLKQNPNLLEFIYDKKALDVGASSGGFTQILLESNIKSVVALDVGRNQLDPFLNNAGFRLLSLEGLDIRDFSKDFKAILESKNSLEFIKEDKPFNIIACDVSFISLRYILDSLLALGDAFIFLFKPQFEVGIKAKRSKKGVLLDSKEALNALESFLATLKSKGLKDIFNAKSIIKGKEGNEEFFIFCRF